MGRYIVTAAAVRTGTPPQFARAGTEIELDDEAAETGRWLSLGAIKPSDDEGDQDAAASTAADDAEQVASKAKAPRASRRARQ